MQLNLIIFLEVSVCLHGCGKYKGTIKIKINYGSKIIPLLCPTNRQPTSDLCPAWHSSFPNQLRLVQKKIVWTNNWICVLHCLEISTMIHKAILAHLGTQRHAEIFTYHHSRHGQFSSNVIMCGACCLTFCEDNVDLGLLTGYWVPK